MASEDAVNKARLSQAIDSRYDNQYSGQRDWSPKQKRRKHGLSLFEMYF